MRLAVYKHDGTEHLGFISGDTVVDPNLGLAADAPERAFFADTVAFIRSAEAGRAAAEHMLKNAPASARLPLALARACGARAPIDHFVQRKQLPRS